MSLATDSKIYVSGPLKCMVFIVKGNKSDIQTAKLGALSSMGADRKAIRETAMAAYYISDAL